jgi:hypothetical protein
VARKNRVAARYPQTPRQINIFGVLHAMPNPVIVATARQIAAAVAQHEKAAVAFEGARAARQRIVDRLGALDAKRAEIIARRQRGEVEPNDGGELALISADQEGLTAMLPDATAIVTAARAPVQAADQAIAAARQGLQQAEDEAAETALAAHAARLDALLLATVEQLGSVHGRLHRTQPAWGPSRTLSEALRRLQLQRGEI